MCPVQSVIQFLDEKPNVRDKQAFFACIMDHYWRNIRQILFTISEFDVILLMTCRILFVTSSLFLVLHNDIFSVGQVSTRKNTTNTFETGQCQRIQIMVDRP